MKGHTQGLGEVLGPARLAAVGEDEQGDALGGQGVPLGGQLGGGLGDPVGDQSVVQVSQHQPDAPGGQGLWVQGGKTGVDPPGNG